MFLLHVPYALGHPPSFPRAVGWLQVPAPGERIPPLPFCHPQPQDQQLSCERLLSRKPGYEMILPEHPRTGPGTASEQCDNHCPLHSTLHSTSLHFCSLVKGGAAAPTGWNCLCPARQEENYILKPRSEVSKCCLTPCLTCYGLTAFAWAAWSQLTPSQRFGSFSLHFCTALASNLESRIRKEGQTNWAVVSCHHKYLYCEKYHKITPAVLEKTVLAF